MKNSILAQCWFRDDEFSNFFTSLEDADIKMTESAVILRQIFGEVMAGIATFDGDTGFRNPVELSGDRQIGDLWKGFGSNAAINAICKEALRRGAKYSEMKAFLRAIAGERLSYGTWFRTDALLKMVSRIHYNMNGEEYTDGAVEDGKILHFLGKKAHRVGRAYFVEDLTGCSHFPTASDGTMWVKK